MNRPDAIDDEFAACLELLERGAPPEGSQMPLTVDVVDLLSLAHQLRTMPPVEPDSAWMEASKHRLLSRFAARRRETRPPIPSPDSVSFAE